MTDAVSSNSGHRGNTHGDTERSDWTQASMLTREKRLARD